MRATTVTEGDRPKPPVVALSVENVRGGRGARQMKAAGVLALKEVQGQKKGGEGQEEPQIRGGRT